MKKILFVLLLSLSVYGQNAGKTGFATLKLPVGARNASLGNTGVSSSSDVTALFYNPAALNESSSDELFIFHNQWIQGVSSEYFAAKTSFWGLTAAAGVSISSVNNIEIRQIAGEPEGTFNSHAMTVSMGVAFSPAQNWQSGVTIKYLYEDYLADQADGFAFDLGAVYTLSGLRLSAALSNLGSMNNLKNNPTKLPATFRAGVNKSFAGVFPQFDIAASAELQQQLTSGTFGINAGAELIYDNLVSFRAGTLPLNEANYLTAGLGFHFSGIHVDYGFTPFAEDLGAGHLISLNYRF
ncbi:MAG: hypothetical protein AMXMBFR48_02310 [Ignavibacteriales bacterium]